ncbi:MAG: DUF2939 domain-containing protein [Polaromonas sp.]|uniref:DUF2939 domain-containing protein n=1 Tax=Polaromonas sp. TaxID=1869339 RepID=UPI00248915A5|nr:DUF2939 domain-containing protein [Polaromonas sp.]MDI1270497.1 DUF2939 domain-containing protein [Polaromonas sp.]
MTSKTIKGAAVAAVLTIAGYWYWSPFLAVRQLQSAAQKKDADAFNERVDYPKLRESLKGQFAAIMGERLVKPEDAGNGFAALGAMLGLAMVNQFVDAMVRPEAVMRAMQDGQLAPKANSPSDSPAPTPPAGKPDVTAKAEPQEDKPKWAYERKGVDKLIAYASDPMKPEVPNQEKLGLVFQRSGFADWKLTEFRLPALKE